MTTHDDEDDTVSRRAAGGSGLTTVGARFLKPIIATGLGSMHLGSCCRAKADIQHFRDETGPSSASTQHPQAGDLSAKSSRSSLQSADSCMDTSAISLPGNQSPAFMVA